MNSVRSLPILRRGTLEWDQRETQRANQFCRCLSYGVIPREHVERVANVRDAVRIPSAERQRELRARAKERRRTK